MPEDKPSLAPSLAPQRERMSLAPQRLAPAGGRSSVSSLRAPGSRSESFDGGAGPARSRTGSMDGPAGSTPSLAPHTTGGPQARMTPSVAAAAPNVLAQLTLESKKKDNVELEEAKRAAAAAEEGHDGDAGGEEDDMEKEPAEMKHPLAVDWTMWYDGGSKDQAAYASNFKDVATVRTVEGFWRLFNNMPQPSQLTLKSNYHFFRYGVMPAWEDPQNVPGGAWILELPPGDNDTLNQCWIYTLLAIVGNAFDDADEICGLVISPRKTRNKIALWTKSSNNEMVVKRLGRQFRGFMEIPSKVKISFQVHDKAKKGVYPRGQGGDHTL